MSNGKPWHTGHAKPSSLARSNITACNRCRHRKKRCDQKLPACGLCVAAGVNCIGYDPVVQRDVPRSYVYDLENQVASLKSQLRQCSSESVNNRDQGERANESPEASRDDLNSQEAPSHGTLREGFGTLPSMDQTREFAAQEALKDILHMMQSAPSHDYTFTKVLVTELMSFDKVSSTNRHLEKQSAGDEEPAGPSIFDGLALPPNPLPKRKAAEYFIKAYFTFANFNLPLLHEPTFYQRLDLIYSRGTATSTGTEPVEDKYDLSIATFFVNMVFALGLLTLQKHNPSRFPTLLSDRYYQTALNALDDAVLPKNVEGVQALLLLAQYAYLHPVTFGGWNMIGVALRRAVELGLHKDSPAGTVDCLTLDVMRRTFWVAYSLDRNIAVATGRPTCLPDSAITAKYPSPVDDEYITADRIADSHPATTNKKAYSFHWFRYRQLQSEMSSVLREKTPPGYPPIDYIEWQSAMRDRLQHWYGQVYQENQPTEEGVGNVVVPSRFELTFQRALVFLYRPSTNIPSPSRQAMMELGSSSAKVITLYKQFYNENKIYLYWQAIDNLFDAGTALLYSFANSDLVREVCTLRELENLINSTLNLLWGSVEHFPAFKGKRDAFELLASKTLADLGSQNFTTNVLNLSTSVHRGERSPSSSLQKSMGDRHAATDNSLNFNFSTPSIGTELLDPALANETMDSLSELTAGHREGLHGHAPGHSVNNIPGLYLGPSVSEQPVEWEISDDANQMPALAWCDWE